MAVESASHVFHCYFRQNVIQRRKVKNDMNQNLLIFVCLKSVLIPSNQSKYFFLAVRCEYLDFGAAPKTKAPFQVRSCFVPD
jgi:hypothetical protein